MNTAMFIADRAKDGKEPFVVPGTDAKDYLFFRPKRA